MALWETHLTTLPAAPPPCHARMLTHSSGESPGHRALQGRAPPSPALAFCSALKALLPVPGAWSRSLPLSTLLQWPGIFSDTFPSALPITQLGYHLLREASLTAPAPTRSDLHFTGSPGTGFHSVRQKSTWGRLPSSAAYLPLDSKVYGVRGQAFCFFSRHHNT